MPAALNSTEAILNNPLYLAYMLGYTKVNTPTHAQWIDQSIHSEDDCAIFGHRGSYKTTARCVIGIIGFQLFHPDKNVLILRKTAGEARMTMLEIMNHWERNEGLRALYHELYGKTPESAEWSKVEGFNLSAKTRVTKERNLACGGIDQPITGAHYDRIYADDIVTLKDRTSPHERERTKLFMQEISGNILNPDGAMIYSGTPWHKSDYWSDLEKDIPIDKYPVMLDFIPDFTEEHKKKLQRKMTSSMYAANYELKHISDAGAIFGDPNYGDLPVKVPVTAWIDPAFGGNDYTAMVIGAIYDNRIYIVYGAVWSGQVNETTIRVIQTCQEWSPKIVYIENNGAQDAYRALINKMDPDINLSGIKNTKNKYVRIDENLVANFHKVFFSNSVEADCMAQIMDYQVPADYSKKAEYPVDAVDALAGLIKQLAPTQQAGYEEMF